MTIMSSHIDVTPAVLKVMEQTEDPRLREIMVSLVKHLHGFIRDVRLTETEFQQATKILNTMGQQSNDKHNEFVLMAGSLGVRRWSACSTMVTTARQKPPSPSWGRSGAWTSR